MINNIFKGLYLIISLCVVILLFKIYSSLESNTGNGRYQYYLVPGSEASKIFDSKEGIVYTYFQGDFAYYTGGGSVLHIKKLPE